MKRALFGQHQPRKIYEGPIQVYQYDRDFQRIGPVPTYAGTVINRATNIHTYQLSIAVTNPAWTLAMPDHDLTGHHMAIHHGPDAPLIAGPVVDTRLAYRQGQWSLEVRGECYLTYPHRMISLPTPTRRLDAQDVEGYYKLARRPAETNIKQLIREHVGQDAADWNITPLVVADDRGRGDNTTLNSRFKNVFEEAQTMATTGNLIMTTRLEQTDVHDFHPVLDVRTPRDLSNHIILTTGNGGIVEADVNNTAPEATRVLVAGQGEAEQRTLVNVEHDPGDWNLPTTVFQDRRDTDDHDELSQAGQETLADNTETVGITATIVELDHAKYGRDYLVGDTIGLGVGPGTPTPDTVTEATTTWNAAGTRTNITTGSTASQDSTATVDQLRKIVKAIQPGRTI